MPEPPVPRRVAGTMTRADLTPDELHRYARHLALPHVGPEGQARLRDARVLCVGAGGLGSPLALYLAAAGVGTLGLVDDDVVDLTNLQRQLLHGTSDVGRPKLDSARDRLHDVNPHVEVEAHPVRLTSANALEILEPYDIVVDGTDNFPTRYLVNDACVLLGKPNVYGSIFRWEGQVSVFAVEGGPCYRCLFREPPPPGLVPNCAEGGVLGVLPGIIGSLQALETIKLILGAGDSLVGRLLLFDAMGMEWREVSIRRNPDCPVCGDTPTQTGLIDYEFFCGVDADGAPLEREADDGVDSGTPGSQGDDDGSDPTATTRARGPGPEARRPPVPHLDPAELAARLGSDEPPFLLDVREAWEWAVGSLEDRGAAHIPLGELPDRIDDVPRDRPVVVYCRSGQRSLDAARALARAGASDVANLRGGLKAWARDVDPDLPVA